MKVRILNLSGGVLVLPGIGELSRGEQRTAFVAEADQHLVISNLETGRISGKLTYSVVDDVELAVDADVVTDLVATDVAKAVAVTGSAEDGTPIVRIAGVNSKPFGILMAANGKTGVVRRLGLARCTVTLNSVTVAVPGENGALASGNLSATGSVIGHVLKPDMGVVGGSTIFVTALITAGLTA